jgi:hypothetical protein
VSNPLRRMRGDHPPAHARGCNPGPAYYDVFGATWRQNGPDCRWCGTSCEPPDARVLLVALSALADKGCGERTRGAWFQLCIAVHDAQDEVAIYAVHTLALHGFSADQLHDLLARYRSDGAAGVDAILAEMDWYAKACPRCFHDASCAVRWIAAVRGR